MNETYVLCNDSENESYNYSKCSKEELFNHLTTLVNQRKLLRDRYCNSTVLSNYDYQTLRLTNSKIRQIQNLIVERILNHQYDYQSTKQQFQIYRTFLDTDDRLEFFRRQEILETEDEFEDNTIQISELYPAKSNIKSNMESIICLIIIHTFIFYLLTMF